MASPFPGMDPYLEELGGWPGVHAWLISVIGETLINQLAPHYSVSIEERVYITNDDHQRLEITRNITQAPITNCLSPISLAPTSAPPRSTARTTGRTAAAGSAPHTR